jgi:hypothetical protein
MASKKSISHADLLAFLKESRAQLPPLSTADVQIMPTLPLRGRELRPDALLTLQGPGGSYRFVVEAKRSWTPKDVAAAAETARESARLLGVSPMVLVPYLSEQQLRWLEAQGVSGIDLCGNGLVTAPDGLFVLRTGFPNQFRWEATIKNVYRKTSSIVARVFLLVPEFPSVADALAQIRKRGGEVTLATVSKVCKRLEDDLVIERGRGDSPVARRLRLLQPEKLLDLLADNYVPPEVSRSFRGKTSLPPEELRQRLARTAAQVGAKVILTGASSVEAYAVMARDPVQTFYSTNIAKAIDSLGGAVRETDRFVNLAFQQTRDELVYFDPRPGLVASPIQSYLELRNGDMREQETADQVRRVILGQRGQAPQAEA